MVNTIIVVNPGRRFLEEDGDVCAKKEYDLSVPPIGAMLVAWRYIVRRTSTCLEHQRYSKHLIGEILVRMAPWTAMNWSGC